MPEDGDCPAHRTIAQAAQTARSSTIKALVTLEQRHLAHRDRGNQNGPKRRPDLWRTHHTEAAPRSNEPPAQEEPAEPAPAPAPAPAPGREPAADTSEPGTGSDDPTVNEPEENCDVPVLVEAAPAAALPAQRTEPAEPSHRAPITALPSRNKRLAPGGLRQLVIDHLNAHPDEAFTATRISRTIDRSSGAIANALATLAKPGIAEQVSERPHLPPGNAGAQRITDRSQRTALAPSGVGNQSGRCVSLPHQAARTLAPATSTAGSSSGHRQQTSCSPPPGAQSSMNRTVTLSRRPEPLT
ncbi:hypothetical protein ACFVW9_22570 [Streptomyces sp. NPDC058217]|uniref:hypothetical protein n=1 Tax=Streptomyces sp. NPDC058217 TaxID=3346384 RepID=UPI0036E3D834